MSVIIISGTPGTGKTFIAKALAAQLGFRHIDVHKLIIEKGLREQYDRQRRTWVVDEKKLIHVLIHIIKKSQDVVIDSHLAHYLPPRWADICIITTCNLKVLEQRLKKRKYIKNKIRENLDAEIFGVCLHEAEELGHDVLVVNTTKKVDIKALVARLKKKTLK